MHIVYANEKAPESYTKSIFLAGPTPRSADVPSWRPNALNVLKQLRYDGVVFVPETRDGKWKHDYSDQVEWEEKYLNMADCILFWVPRTLDMPGFTTNDEWGFWKDSGKVVFGAPVVADKVKYQKYYADKLHVPRALTLGNTVRDAVSFVGEGSLRAGGEREVPLYIWNTPHFQEWYSTQKSAGNRLDGARVQWAFRVGPERDIVFLWALHVDIYIASEKRHKRNEVVISRPDISTVLMYYPGKDIFDTDIVLVREFRSPVSNSDGFVWELPGGSTFNPGVSPAQLAIDECREEVGIRIFSPWMKIHEVRQLASTLSAHKAHLFSVELRSYELDALRARQGTLRGALEDNNECTYIEIVKVRDLLGDDRIDWSMLGMIMNVLSQVY